MSSELLCTLLIIAIGLTIIGFMVYTININTMKNEGMLKAQIEASKVKSSMHVTSLPYDALIKVINDLISFYVSNAVLLRGLSAKREDELSVLIDEVITDICTNVYNAMSDELKAGVLFYVSENHLKLLIKDNVRIITLAKLSGLLKSPIQR